MTDTLGDALPRKMARIRDVVLPHYVELGAVGAIGAHLIRVDLDNAARALASGDVTDMIYAYQRLLEIAD